MPDVLYPDDLALPPAISASAYGPVVEVVIPLAPPSRDPRLDTLEGRLDGLAVDDVGGLDTALAGKLDKSGGTMTGLLTLSGAPSSSLHAVTKAYADGLIAAADAMIFKGVIDCSTNPNYPAADRGWTYRVSVAGKIGGGSGPNVEAGDLIICLTDGTAAGNHATVGSSWTISQVNIDGAVVGPAGATDDLPVVFDGASGRLVKVKTYAAFKTLLALLKGDVGLGNVDNTSDANKPVSTAQATADGLRVLKAGDTMTGPLVLPADPTLALQAATKQYVDQIVAAQDAMVFKGVIDCSANPDYPAADRGWTYRVSVAGKIGGASGANVEAGDILLCLTDGTASGNQATVGASWSAIQTNIDGAVTLTGTQTLTNKTLSSPIISTGATFSMSAAADLKLARVSDATTFNLVSFNGATNQAALGIFAGGDTSLYYNALFGGAHQWRVDGVTRALLSASALYPNTNNGLASGSSTNNWSATYSTLYYVGSLQVVGARKVGWGTATGTATRTTFDTTTVTVAQLAERVKALIDDLHGTAGHGLIGT